MVTCLERGADLHVAQLMPLPLTVSCFSKIEIGFTFLVPAHPGSPGQRAVKWVCVCNIIEIEIQVVVLSKPGSYNKPKQQEAQLSPRDRAMRRVN